MGKGPLPPPSPLHIRNISFAIQTCKTDLQIWLITLSLIVYNSNLDLPDKKIYQHLFDFPDSVGLLISLHRWQPHGCKLGSCECRRADLAIGHTGTLYMGGDDPQRCDMGLPGVQTARSARGARSVRSVMRCSTIVLRLTWFGRASLNDMVST